MPVCIGLDLLEQLYWATGAVLLCARRCSPEYLIWMVPFLCFSKSCLAAADWVKSLSYYVLIDWWTLGLWRQNDLFLKLQYFPFYGLLIWNFLRVCRAKTKVRCANKSLMPK